MFEKGLRDEIGSVVTGSLHTSYRRYVESRGSVEAIVATKTKAKETHVQTKVNVEPQTQEQAKFVAKLKMT